MGLNDLLAAEIEKKRKRLDDETDAVKLKPKELLKRQEVPQQVKEQHYTGTEGRLEGLKPSKPAEDALLLVNRLKTRPERIDAIIAQESQVKTQITVETIQEEQTDLLSIQCNLFIHTVLRSWTTDNYKPDLILDTKRALYPLLLKLRRKTLPTQLLISLSTILFHMQRSEFSLATQSYMELSIGNVAWPIGVVSVGIHARRAHERIQGKDKVANVMLDDTTRLWITSVKRLITYWADRDRRSRSTESLIISH
ncbi:LAMI_0D05512g1_1 [Lachancea mirantina]|uniref:Pre-mRNA-splicing factor 18 n=1 Tax=Lachancea mirantina TaxID=1230905 RepID=A0A1G4JBT6_9SACH|nr:LAMI_0D05512g1_1 [Lachancea mirantina]